MCEWGLSLSLCAHPASFGKSEKWVTCWHLASVAEEFEVAGRQRDDEEKGYNETYLSGKRMQRFLQFRLGSQLPVFVEDHGRFAGGQHVARANRVCTHCGGVAVADETHMTFEYAALHALRQQYAPLFSKIPQVRHSTSTDTVQSFFAQQDHTQVSRFVLSCLDVLQI